jgi:hypothetical protein
VIPATATDFYWLPADVLIDAGEGTFVLYALVRRDEKGMLRIDVVTPSNWRI